MNVCDECKKTDAGRFPAFQREIRNIFINDNYVLFPIKLKALLLSGRKIKFKSIIFTPGFNSRSFSTYFKNKNKNIGGFK